MGFIGMCCYKDFYSVCASSVILVLAIVSLGCDGKPATVAGTVSLDGELLRQGTIAFVPANGGMRSTALIESDGNYEVRTNRDLGLEIGEYKVAVSSREVVTRGNGGLPVPSKYLAPKRYGNTETSGLSFEVVKGSNPINLELTSEKK
jgi:hypothetical protein